MLLHLIFYKLEFVFVHFISIMYSKIDTLHYWEIIKASFYFLQIWNIWIFVEIMLKYVHTSFCYENDFIWIL